MRVLRVSHSAVVSAWRERERELRRRGHDVYLLCARRWDEGGRPVGLEDGEPFVSGVRTFGTHPNLFAFDPRPIWRALRDGPWDVVDVHEEPCSVAAFEVFVLRALSRVRAPVVLYSAQNIEKRYPPPFRWMERYALSRTAGVSVCNRDAGKILRRKGFTGAVSEIPLGVDLGRFAAAERNVPRRELRVGYVGRLAEHKGVDVLLQTLTRMPDVQLDIVGDGPQATDLRRHAELLGVDGRVRFTGHTVNLAPKYREFDVLAVPSLPRPNWLEQFGRVVVESMASGVPVVASRSGALPDVVGDAGLLAAPGDVDDWTRALTMLHSSPDMWTRLRRAGTERVRQYSWSAVAERLEALYGRIAVPATGPRSVEVVVVAYGTPDLLREALRPLAGRVPVVVVDNSSSAQVRAVVTHAGARYVDPGRNAGFAAGVNCGLSHLSDPTSDVLLLNPDAVLTPEDLRVLQDVLRADPATAAVAPRQHDAVSRPAQIEWPFPAPWRAWLEAVGLSRLSRRRGFLVGSVLLLRREALTQVGTFDERFFLYAEEADWQRRAVRLGWHVRLVPEATASHAGAATATNPVLRETLFHAAQEIYVRKHYGSAGWLAYRAAVIVGAVLRGAVLPGARGRQAVRRARLYVTGPARTARIMRSGR